MLQTSGGYYVNEEDLKEILNDAFETAIRKASLEAFEGEFSPQELIEKIDPELIKIQALELIKHQH